jgi:hypothetical protein
MVSIICYTNSTRTLEHSYFTSSQLLRQGNSSITIFQSTDDVLTGSLYLVCTHLVMSKDTCNLFFHCQINLMREKPFWTSFSSFWLFWHKLNYLVSLECLNFLLFWSMYVLFNLGHRVVGITNGHSFHAGP